jgi:hypothetical protein
VRWCEGVTPDQMSVAVEEDDFEGHFSALEYACRRPPCGFGDDLPKPKMVQ